MNRPIINPSTLTEEQREAIKAEFIKLNELPQTMSKSLVKMIAVMNFTMVKIFGKELFNDKEK